jgi:hypothetical protein
MVQAMDEQTHVLPATLNGLQDENRGLRDQVKALKEKLTTEERASKVNKRKEGIEGEGGKGEREGEGGGRGREITKKQNKTKQKKCGANNTL